MQLGFGMSRRALESIRPQAIALAALTVLLLTGSRSHADHVALFASDVFDRRGNNILEIQLESLGARQGIQLELSYDPSLIAAASVQPTGRLEGVLQTFSSTSEPGIVRVLFSDESIQRQSVSAGAGTVASIRFDVVAPEHLPRTETDIVVTGVLIADESITAVETTVSNVRVLVDPVVSVLLQSFEAVRVTPGVVQIRWSLSATELNSSLRLYRVEERGRQSLFDEPLTLERLNHQVLDQLPVALLSQPVAYALVSAQSEAELQLASAAVDVVPAQPLRLELEQIAPNPFNPSARILFTLPHQTRASLRILDVAGRLVRTLIDSDLPAGSLIVVWDGTDDNATSVASAIYLCALSAGGRVVTRKITLLK